jgi:hypothetical protein
VNFDKCSLEHVLEIEIAKDREPTGGITPVLFNSNKNPSQCWGLCININHVLGDGQSMMEIVKAFASAMQSEVCARPADSFHCGPSSISPDWGSLIKSAGLNHSGQGSAYLPIADAISFSDIRSLSAKDGDQVSHNFSTRKTVASSDVQRIKAVSRSTPALAGGARWTLGGLWMACFAQAVGEAYLKEGRTSASTIPSCCVSVSMQVDLRPSLTKSLPGNDRLVAQALLLW